MRGQDCPEGPTLCVASNCYVRADYSASTLEIDPAVLITQLETIYYSGYHLSKYEVKYSTRLASLMMKVT